MGSDNERVQLKPDISPKPSPCSVQIATEAVAEDCRILGGDATDVVIGPVAIHVIRKDNADPTSSCTVAIFVSVQRRA